MKWKEPKEINESERKKKRMGSRIMEKERSEKKIRGKEIRGRQSKRREI